MLRIGEAQDADAARAGMRRGSHWISACVPGAATTPIGVARPIGRGGDGFERADRRRLGKARPGRFLEARRPDRHAG